MTVDECGVEIEFVDGSASARRASDCHHIGVWKSVSLYSIRRGLEFFIAVTGESFNLELMIFASVMSHARPHEIVGNYQSRPPLNLVTFHIWARTNVCALSIPTHKFA